MGKINSFIKKLGPGLLFAGTAIGVSHLVQSTKAGAEFGFGLTWALIIAILLKYPFFKFAPKYSIATNESVLHGYKKLHPIIPVIFFIITLGTMFTIQTAVTIVTAGIANSVFDNIISIEIWTVIILFISFLLLIIGKYNTLDRVIKILIIALAVSTILSFFFAGINFDQAIKLEQVFPKESVSIVFLIAFMGWMPAPLDVSVWNSLWTVEKIKLQKQNSISNSMFDFNLGYFGTAILGICFIGVGYFTIYNSSEKLSESTALFSEQLIRLYTDNLGDWSYYLIAFAALSTMLSTTITALDASPRAMGITSELILNKKIKKAYLFWISLLSIGTLIIFFVFTSQMGLLIEIATILSFLTAPFFAVINYLLITSKYTPADFRPNLFMHILSVVGIIYLLGFSVWFLLNGGSEKIFYILNRYLEFYN